MVYLKSRTNGMEMVKEMFRSMTNTQIHDNMYTFSIELLAIAFKRFY